MSTPTHHLRRLGLLAATLAICALAAPTVASAAPDPRVRAREELAQAQALASAAAQRYSDAQTEQARLEEEIARLEREIPVLRARSTELREEVRARAVQLYREGNAGPLSRLLAVEDVVDAARATQLTERAAVHDRELAAELTRTAKKLEDDERELQARKAEQDALVADLAKQSDVLNALMTAANAALAKLEAIAASQAEFAGTPGAAAGQVATGAAVCPVAGPVVFTNDFGNPRSGGRTHAGNDMFAAIGTPDVAVVDGYMTNSSGGLGGIAVMLHGADGVEYYYAHLSRIEGPDRPVKRGEVIGYVGDTGNAAGGAPHTHFEMRPAGGASVNPYPTIRVLCPQ